MKLYFISLLAVVFGDASNTIKRNAGEHPQKGFAVIELFTSQGCSSCPPADEAVAEIQEKYPENVYVLSFHVDYWDYLGWKDEFSDASFTTRQVHYASAFHLQSMYTPQVVVNGKTEFVGSDKTRLEKTIGESLKSAAKRDIELTVTATSGQHIVMQYETNADNRHVLNAALVQLHAASDVKRGENKGRKLKHLNVVRGFKSVAAGNGKGTVEFDIPAGLVKSDCKIIAWLQDKESLIIDAAGQAAIR